MESIQLLDLLLHTDQFLLTLMNDLGPWLYFILFMIIFLETGFVIIPFLPGDSLLFAAGALCALPGSPMRIEILMGLLFIAAVLGDFVNYHVGRFLGPKIFSQDKSIFFNKSHLVKTQEFYEKYGGKTIIIARFVPIVRTFAPFVAGIGKMNYSHFFIYNIIGAAAWVVSFLLLGEFFGNLPFVKKYFQFVILGIIVLSVLPILIEWLKHKRTLKPKLNENI